MYHSLILYNMARSKSFFGLRRGSTKTLTFSVLKGDQITKDRVEGGRNPRTPEQMVQRMCMATASAAYAQMKQIVDHSFEGIVYGQDTMSEFIRKNAAALRDNYLNGGEAFAYNPYRDRELYPGAYVMSAGSASPIEVAERLGDPGISVQVMSSSGSGYSVSLLPLNDSDAQTANSIMQAIGIGVGDMATVCVLWPQTNISGMSFSFLRIRALKSGSTPLDAENIGEYFSFESPHPVAVSITGRLISLTVSPSGYEKNMPGMFCVIHSLKTASGWLRSNAAMVGEDGLDVSPIAEDALATYPVGQSYVLNGGDV